MYVQFVSTCAGPNDILECTGRHYSSCYIITLKVSQMYVKLFLEIIIGSNRGMFFQKYSIE